MTIQERYGVGAVTGDGQSATVRFWITGHTAWADAYNELYNASVGYTSGPVNYSGFNGIPAQSVTVDEVAERLGYWNGSVSYSYDTPRGNAPQTTAVPELEFSFDTSVQPKLERWLSDGDGWTQQGAIVPASGETAVPHDGLGYSSIERSYEGIEVLRPATQFNLEYTPTTLSQANLVGISGAVGAVNSAAFYGFAVGEVLFAGAQGQAKVNDRWRLSYQFLAKSNRTAVDCGNGVSIAACDGWDVIEVEYKRLVIDIGGKDKTIERTRQARVMRPFRRVNFNTVIFP